MGIGKRLMNDLKDYFSKMSAESISVFTDSKCNYGFYDSQGFRRIGTKDVVLNMTPEMGPMRIFLYDYHHQP
jgi:ribosomal protein S18 acetylase RimI-like enzyme